MPVYIAMLRGINVGPHKRMKMEKLRASCEAAGMKKVKTYVQSGNVVFQAAISSPAVSAKKLEAQIVKDFGFTADVIVRTKDEMSGIIARNPFAKESGIDPAKLHAVFLAETPAPAAVNKLESLTTLPDKARHSGKEIYFYFPNGVSGSSLWKHPLDKVLSVSATMRNWKTVTALYEMAVACG
jgi:uncharacterized protein (DUF1697 family)